MCKACRNTYPSASKDVIAEHEAICWRAKSQKPGAYGAYWELEPGYVADEIVADRGKPSTKPRVETKGRYAMNPKSWADTWRETWELAQKANNNVRYVRREDFLADLAALMRLQWEIPHPWRPV